MSTFQLYIPTRGRVGHNRQVTLRQFEQFSSHKPIIVCPREEVAAHMEYWPRVMGCPAEGIGPTRQWIVENSRVDTLIMADDDMRFSKRPDPYQPQLAPCENLDELLGLIVQCVEHRGFIHGGVGARQGNNHKDGEVAVDNLPPYEWYKARKGYVRDGRPYTGLHLFVECERVNNFHFIDRRKVAALGVRWDQLPVMEDFHFTLSLLTRGYPNVLIHSIVWNQEGSGREGGCSSYRTAAVQAAGADGLAAAFPRFVRVTEKESKDTSPAWKDFKVRKDVVVYWSKAYESSWEK